MSAGRATSERCWRARYRGESLGVQEAEPERELDVLVAVRESKFSNYHSMF